MERRDEFTTVSLKRSLLEAVDKVVENVKTSYGQKWDSRAAFVKEAVEEKLGQELKKA